MLTADGTADAVKRAINESEVHRFISKPFEPNELRAAVDGAIARRHELIQHSRATQSAPRRLAAIRNVESHHPGLTTVMRDDAGAYCLDIERTRAASVGAGLAQFAIGRLQ